MTVLFLVNVSRHMPFFVIQLNKYLSFTLLRRTTLTPTSYWKERTLGTRVLCSSSPEETPWTPCRNQYFGSTRSPPPTRASAQYSYVFLQYVILLYSQNIYFFLPYPVMVDNLPYNRSKTLVPIRFISPIVAYSLAECLPVTIS